MINHIYNNAVKNFKANELVEMVSELTAALKKVVSVISSIEALKKGDEDEFDVLDKLELSMIDSMDITKQYTMYGCSDVEAIARCLINACGSVEDTENTGLIQYYNKLIDFLVTSWAGISESDAEAIYDASKELAGILAYVICYEFNLDETLESYKETGSQGAMEVNEVFKHYCKLYNIDILQFVNTIMELCTIYRPTLRVFEEHPELEDEFCKKVGPYYSDIEPDRLTLEMVVAVIQGTINPSDLYEITHGIVEGE